MANPLTRRGIPLTPSQPEPGPGGSEGKRGPGYVPQQPGGPLPGQIDPGSGMPVPPYAPFIPGTKNKPTGYAVPVADVPTDPNQPALPGVQGTPPIPGDWGPGTKWGPQGTPGPDPQWLTKFPWYQEPGHPGEPYHPLDPFWQKRKHVKPAASHTTPATPQPETTDGGGGDLPSHHQVGQLLGRGLGQLLMMNKQQQINDAHDQLYDHLDAQGAIE